MTSLRAILRVLRNRWHPSNQYRVARGACLRNEGNVLRSSFKISAGNTVAIGPGARIRDALVVVAGSGNLVSFGPGVEFRGQIDIVGDGNRLIIGARTKINEAFLLVHNGTEISIGADCLLSRQIEMRTTDSHEIFDSAQVRINPDANIRIGDQVWLGVGVMILKGAHIESGCVIGARSLVSGHIGAKALAAGVPAKVLKSDISWRE